SVPSSIIETHELSSMTLEYRRECGRETMCRSSLANVVTVQVVLMGYRILGNVECQHLLRLDDGSEVIRARTERGRSTTQRASENSGGS
ncbi:hypothetical protein Dimus_036871, partial [Dionaea muscipula]